MPKQQKMSMKEFVEGGYLQEVNRQFFHGLGLAMEVKKTGNEYEFSGLWDFRQIKGGILFGEKVIKDKEFIDRTNNIKGIQKLNNSLRKQAYNEIRQSIPKTVDE